MSDPFLIQGPALISFSGGRTSAYMLWRILQAHGGSLPDDVVVAFANTGKEREETLRFVHECAVRWNVRVHWVEWRPNQKQAAIAMPRARPEVAAWIERHTTETGFEEVGFNSASRLGEPFSALIAHRGFVPYGGTPSTRFCSPVLKIRAMAKFARSLGWERWLNPVGLRRDEFWRVLKQMDRNASGLERFTASMPLATANVIKADVKTFWLGPTMRLGDGVRPQGFDLELEDEEGNCDRCMLKRRGTLMRLEKSQPGGSDWWIAEEQWAHRHAKTASGQSFFNNDTYAAIKRDAHASQDLFDWADGDEHDAECGLWCSGEAA